MGVYAYNAYIHTYVHSFIHTHGNIHLNTCACIHTYIIRMGIYAYIRKYIHTEPTQSFPHATARHVRSALRLPTVAVGHVGCKVTKSSFVAGADQ